MLKQFNVMLARDENTKLKQFNVMLAQDKNQCWLILNFSRPQLGRPQNTVNVALLPYQCEMKRGD
jgi:hypothetical protein